MKKIFVVILHFGEIALTRECIQTLQEKDKGYAKIIVVNNNEKNIAPGALPFKRITLINNKRNIGFAAGVNVGIRYAIRNGADAILFLNNDTLIKKPFINELSAILSNDPSVGIVGPAICFTKNGKKIFDIGGSINMLTGRTSHREVEEVKDIPLRFVTYVSGAAMMIKREVFERVGLFDEQFFLYYEDADFCLRAAKKGFRVAVDPHAIVFHLLSKTIGKVSPFAVFYQTQSAVFFGRKYMQTFSQKFFHLLFLLAQTIRISLKHPQAGLAGWKAIFTS